MKPPHRTCECGFEAKFGVGWEEHLRTEHGYITVHCQPSGNVKLVPILSHPWHKRHRFGPPLEYPRPCGGEDYLSGAECKMTMYSADDHTSHHAATGH